MQQRLCKNNPIITCEGETEKWYFQHFKVLVNNSSACTMRLDYEEPFVTKEPLRRAKYISIPFERKWYHIIDQETNSSSDKITFKNNLKNFNDIKKIRKNVKLYLGYSNISFELWLIMHKTNEQPQVHKPSQYLKLLKKLYNCPNIKELEEFKTKQNFERVLKQITLDDIKRAVRNGQKLELENKKCCAHQKNCGFEYFEENPSTNLHKIIIDIFNDVGIKLSDS